MGDVFIVRRGGSDLSKCSIIVHIDSGSTVAAYSNSAATTLVKTGKEIGTSGDYLITGLNPGTYYVKATKNTDETISGAIMFSANGIKDVVLSYALVIWTAGDGLASFQTLFETTSTYGSMWASGNNVVLSGTWDQDYSGVISKTNAIVLPAGVYSTLAITSKVLSGYGNMWIDIESTKSGDAVSSWHISNSGYNDESFVVRNFTIPSSMTNCYIHFRSINSHSMEISDIRFVR